MRAIVAIAISDNVADKAYIFDNLDAVLESVPEYDVVGINDRNSIVKNYAQERNKKFIEKKSMGRVGARQALANVTHFVGFWSGDDLHEVIFAAHTKAHLRQIRLKIFPLAITTVMNKDAGQQFDVYIGRGSPLGNMFAIEHGTENDRASVIEKFREHFYANIVTDPEMHKYLKSLRGLRLGCHCKPKPCHGDVIADYLNRSAEFD